MRKSISTLLIFLGIFIMLYPKISEAIYTYQQKKIMEDWQSSLLNIEEETEVLESDEDYLILDENHSPSQNKEVSGEIIESENQSIEELEKIKRENERQEYIEGNMEGILKIEKINLYLPILSGATEQNLKISIASIDNTGKAGMSGNYCIAGHRSHTYGRNFNRLDELKIGDIVEVHNGTNNYNYTVYDKFLVKPEEIWVLNSNKVEKEITLITCDPMINPTNRLIIKGKMGP